MKLERVIVDEGGNFIDSDTSEGGRYGEEVCILTNYVKMPNFATKDGTAKPVATSDGQQAPTIQEIVIRKYLYKKMACFSRMIRSESRLVYEEIFNPAFGSRGKGYSGMVTLLREQEELMAADAEKDEGAPAKQYDIE
jgi:hypothetical protein